MKKIKKFFKRIYYYIFLSFKKDTKKASNKDVLLACIYKSKPYKLQHGVKVITRSHGMGVITKVKNPNWYVIKYKNGRVNEVHIDHLFGYWARIIHPKQNEGESYPLSQAHYEYIHPDEDNNVWLEGTITKIKYFHLIDEVLKDQERKLYPHFYRVHNGYQILSELKEKGINITIKNAKNERID